MAFLCETLGVCHASNFLPVATVKTSFIAPGRQDEPGKKSEPVKDWDHALVIQASPDVIATRYSNWFCNQPFFAAPFFADAFLSVFFDALGAAM